MKILLTFLISLSAFAMRPNPFKAAFLQNKEGIAKSTNFLQSDPEDFHEYAKSKAEEYAEAYASDVYTYIQSQAEYYFEKYYEDLVSYIGICPDSDSFIQVSQTDSTTDSSFAVTEVDSAVNGDDVSDSVSSLS